jgi:quercetin dioxygenase-like cupin family protein
LDRKGPDPKDVAANVYKPLLENAKIRVFDVTFKPGAVARMHWHPDHVAYVISGGKLKLKMGDGSINEMDVPTNQAVFMESQSHEAENIGKNEVHLVVVELLK